MGRLKTNFVGKGHVLSVLKKFPDESIDCILTSPPYWKLRDYNTPGVVWGGSDKCKHEWGKYSYQVRSNDSKTEKSWKQFTNEGMVYRDAVIVHFVCTKCGAWKGQLGQEPVIGMFIDHLILVFNELKRVLKKSGSCFVVFGDTYSVGGNVGSGEYKKTHKQFGKVVNLDAAPAPHSTKELPPKCLCMIPERFAIGMLDNQWTLRNQVIWHKPSVMPNPVRDRFTVDFEKIFFFTKNKKYFFNQSFEPYVTPQNRWGGDEYGGGKSNWDENTDHPTNREGRKNRPNPKGRNRRTVWSISAGKYKGAHFAVFPVELCEIVIKAACPEGGVVLDPFCGSGTTMVVAKQLGRKYIGIDNSRGYVDMSRKRLIDEI